MITITKPANGSTLTAGSLISLEGIDGPPTHCVVTCGMIRSEFDIGSGPGQTQLTRSTASGDWAFPLTLPNVAGDCAVLVCSQSDKSGQTDYTLAMGVVVQPVPSP